MLLIEPFASGSHAAWAEGVARASHHEVLSCSLPGAFWRWRIRGAAPTLVPLVEAALGGDGPPDVVLVSSMVDLAQLVGFCRHLLGDAPVVLYMHENQIAFPRRDATDVDAALRSLTSLLIADHVVFNSDHHRRVVAEALPALASVMPDHPLDLDARRLLDRTSVIPVGVDVEGIRRRERHRHRSDGLPTVLWPHRWDPDKQPEVFVRALERLATDGQVVRLVLCGADAWEGEERRRAAVRGLSHPVLHAGHATRTRYAELLGASDIVVSVAAHEFFGVAVVEAIAAGCIPVLPDRLSYPEVVPREYHDVALYPDGGFRRRLAAVAADLDGWRARTDGLADAMARFDWSVVAPQLDAVLGAAAVSAKQTGSGASSGE